ncbi:flagellin [Roseobacter cerasinus]|uniref:Flagellin n=2 Tax=Roseobacter cerasinus TaxID=2602289 RepID=A0A640VM55_9RHOB|nr:flagellin [Roseobacter cerasinus]
MSSILTNNSAMVALQTLKSINMNLGKVQSEISTGLTVESAKDNAATWAISKVMRSDVAGFEAIADSLALGSSTVGVALNAAESITDLLTEIKGKIVNSQEENVDRAKIQTDIEALTSQIQSISAAAQFNGLNLLSNTENGADAAGTGTSNILSSLDRSSTGVAASNISVSKQDLGTGAQTMGTTAVTTLADFIDGTGAAITGASTAAARTFSIDGDGIETSAAGIGYRITLSAPQNDVVLAEGRGTNVVAAGVVTTGVYEYVARDGDTSADIANALNAQISAAGIEGFSVAIATNTTDAAATDMTFNFDAAADGFTVAVAAFTNAGSTIGGGLADLADIDVSTDEGSEDALSKIESLIQTSIDAAAAFGSAGRRIETQNSFVGNLIDNLTSGIGSLVDADMEAASAKLQALQTQQQLGVQALSIANQAPQTILSLFR